MFFSPISGGREGVKDTLSNSRGLLEIVICDQFCVWSTLVLVSRTIRALLTRRPSTSHPRRPAAPVSSLRAAFGEYLLRTHFPGLEALEIVIYDILRLEHNTQA